MSINIECEPNGEYTIYMDNCDYIFGVDAQKKCPSEILSTWKVESIR